MKKSISLILMVIGFLFSNCYSRPVIVVSPYDDNHGKSNLLANDYLITLCLDKKNKYECDAFFLGFSQAIILYSSKAIKILKPFSAVDIQNSYFHFLIDGHLGKSDMLIMMKMPANFTILQALDYKGYIHIKDKQ